MRIILILLLSFVVLCAKDLKNADSCKLSYSIMSMIATAEKSKYRPLGYPYIIAFNSFKIPEYLSKKEKFKKLDKRSIDCLSVDNCIKILASLIENQIHNIDIGAFQANYIYFKFPYDEYFVLEKSYYNACQRLDYLIETYGLSFHTLARYHSSTPEINENYRNKLIKINNGRKLGEKI